MGKFAYIRYDSNLFRNAILTVSTEQTLYPKVNLQTFPVTDVWRSNAELSNITVDFDLGSAQNVNCVTITAHNLTSAATVAVKGGATFPPTTFSENITWAQDQNTLLLKFAAGTQNYRYWRLLITDAANPAGYVQLGYVFGGMLSDFQYFKRNWRRGRETISTTLRSEFGTPMTGLVHAQLKSFVFEFQPITDAERDTLDLFLRLLRRESVPLLVVPDTEQTEAIVGRLTSDYEITQDALAFVSEVTFTEDAVPISVVS